MKCLNTNVIDKILALTKGVFRPRDLWLKETFVIQNTWQPARVVREIVTGGGRVICTLSPDGMDIYPEEHVRMKFPGDTCYKMSIAYVTPDIKKERLDEHIFRINSSDNKNKKTAIATWNDLIRK